VTPEEEGEALREESQIFKKEVGPSGRDAPLGEPPPSEKIVSLSNSDAAQRARLKAKLKAQRRHMIMGYLQATCPGDEVARRVAGMQGFDEAHDAQWWFDHCDAEMIAANWNGCRDRAAARKRRRA
jgi:hypothetical protein